ncbi:hypothetical protein ACFL5G_03190 [Candidatus Margulisiibacteriota bacterium]
MRSFIIIIIMLIMINPLCAESELSTYWSEEGTPATKNVEKVPEEIKDMVDAPKIIKKPLELPRRKSVWEAGAKATLVPSWGHFYVENYNRAVLIAGTEALLLVGIINSDPTKYENTSEATQDTIYQQRETLTVIGGLIWLWSIFDATSIAIENNRRLEEEERKISWSTEDGVKLSYRYDWN